MEEKTKRVLKGTGKMLAGTGMLGWGAVKWVGTTAVPAVVVVAVSAVNKNAGRAVRAQISELTKAGVMKQEQKKITGNTVQNGLEMIISGAEDIIGK